MVLVLFWLDLWEIFFYPTLGFQLGTSESLFLHSTTTPWWLLVFTSDNFRYLTLVQRDWWWYSSDWTCERFSFIPYSKFWTGDLWISFLHSSTAPWWLLVFTSDNFRYLTLVQRDHWWYCSDWMCERFSFSHTWLWNGDHWISCPALYHCTMVTSGFHLWQFQVFNSGAEGSLVVLFWLVLWEIFFISNVGYEMGTYGSLVLHSTTT